VLPKVELRGPPPDPQFLYEPPTLFQQDVDIVRLTAQFVARNGREFLTKLAQQEANNFQFEFLKPHHVLFPFFHRMIEQYSKVCVCVCVCVCVYVCQ
jgi:splicing factor 3A subunit 1